MEEWFDSSQWAHLAELALVWEMEEEVTELENRLHEMVRELAFYGRPPLVAESSATAGPLESRWWVRIGPPAIWHCAYRAKGHTVLNTSEPALQQLVRSLERVPGLQNPLAFAATLRCLAELRLEVSSLPARANEALQSIPGWLESVQIVESFMVAQGLAEGRYLPAAGRGEEDEGSGERREELDDVPF